MGAEAYNLIEKYKSELPNNSVIVEIGSTRGEFSSEYFDNFAKQNNHTFYTVDVDPNQYNYCKNKSINAFNCTGETFLKEIFPEFKQSINFLYLDNFDFIYKHIEGSAMVYDQIQRYNSLNLTMNNTNSQKTHLEQTQESLKYLEFGSFILFDDTFINNEVWDGKGGTAVPYLLNNNFSIVEKSHNNANVWESYVMLRNNNE